MPGYISYRIDYEKIAIEQADAIEKARRYFSALIKNNPDNFFESENNADGTPKSVNIIQNIREKNYLKAYLLYLYAKNKINLDVQQARAINVTLYSLLNNFNSASDTVSLEEIQQLFEKCPEARYYLVLFKDALEYSLSEKIFITELKRRHDKMTPSIKKESMSRLMTALAENTEILLKDKTLLMSEDKTEQLIAFFFDEMPDVCDDLFSVASVMSEEPEDNRVECQSELSEWEDTKNFYHRPSIDFDEEENTVSERTTEEDNSDSSDEENFSGNLVLATQDEIIPKIAKNAVALDVNRLSALAYCYKKMRPRTSLLLSMGKMDKAEKAALSYCIDLLSCTGKKAIMSPFLQRCAALNISPYHILAVFNDKKLGLYAKTIETVAATADSTFNDEMTRYKANPEAYKAHWKAQAAAENRTLSKSS